MPYFVFALCALLLPASASAYIDPGTGGMVVGGISAAFAAILGAGTVIAGFFIKFFWKPIKGLFVKKQPTQEPTAPPSEVKDQ